MADLPWYIRHHWVFLLLAILLAALVMGSIFGVTQELASAWLGVELRGRASDPWRSSVSRPGGGAQLVYILLIALALFSWGWYKSFHRFKEVLDALGDRVVSAEVDSPAWHATLACTTYDGRDFHLYYYEGSKHQRPYYELWVVSQGEPKPFDRSRYVGAIPHLQDLSAWPDGPDGTWRLVARLSDEWLVSETPDILKSLDALYEIRSAR